MHVLFAKAIKDIVGFKIDDFSLNVDEDFGTVGVWFNTNITIEKEEKIKQKLNDYHSYGGLSLEDDYEITQLLFKYVLGEEGKVFVKAVPVFHHRGNVEFEKDRFLLFVSPSFVDNLKPWL